MAATAKRLQREVELWGEIIRPPEGPDRFPYYPCVREGEPVGFVYRVSSQGSEHYVFVYDQIQAPGLARELIDGRIGCLSDQHTNPGSRKCWAVELVRERKAQEARGYGR